MFSLASIFPKMWARDVEEMKQAHSEAVKVVEEMDRVNCLTRPLVFRVATARHYLRKLGVPESEYYWTFSKVEWPKQYKAGINKVLGFHIHWL